MKLKWLVLQKSKKFQENKGRKVIGSKTNIIKEKAYKIELLATGTKALKEQGESHVKVSVGTSSGGR